MLQTPCPVLLRALSASLVVVPSVASAAPIEFVEQRDTYMVFNGDETVENANWYQRDPFLQGYQMVEDGFLASHPDDTDFIIVYTTWDLQGASGMYQAVANDVEGIGYDHIAISDPVIPEEIFDDTPNSRVMGFLHMSRWTRYFGDDAGGVNDSYISLLFGQELGHAWLSFPYYDQGEGAQDNMLGRAMAHWSFYLHTGGSPVQGNAWTDNGDGTFTADRQSDFSYSDLDLYLMGLMPADQVEPWFVLENPSNCGGTGNGECPSAGDHQPPSDGYTITADRRDITIDDVIAAEGPRVPDPSEARDTYYVGFLLIKRASETLDDALLTQFDAVVNRSIEMWEEQTRGLGHLVNTTARTDEPPDDTGDGSGSDESGAEGGTEDGVEDSGTDSSAGEDGPAAEAGAEGGEGGSESCACSQDAGTPSWAGLGLFALGAVAGRRRRASARLCPNRGAPDVPR